MDKPKLVDVVTVTTAGGSPMFPIRKELADKLNIKPKQKWVVKTLGKSVIYEPRDEVE